MYQTAADFRVRGEGGEVGQRVDEEVNKGEVGGLDARISKTDIKGNVGGWCKGMVRGKVR